MSEYNSALPHPEKYNYLRFDREVMVSEDLEGLLAIVSDAAVAVFGDKAAISKKPIRLQAEGLASRPQTFGVIGIPAATIYPVNRLRVTQFEVLVPTSESKKRPLVQRLYNKADSILGQIPLANDELTVSSSAITFKRHPGYTTLGEEIVLPLDTTANAVVLEEQNSLFEQRARRTGAGNELQSYVCPTNLHIALGRVPLFRANRQAEYAAKKEHFLQMMAPYLPITGIELCPVTVAV